MQERDRNMRIRE